MPNLTLNQFTRDERLKEIVGKQLISIRTQSVYSYSCLQPGISLVKDVVRMNNTTFMIEFDNDFVYTVENGLVYYA